MMRRSIAAAFAAVCATFAGAASAQSTAPSPTLDAIRARGTLICGIHHRRRRLRACPTVAASGRASMSRCAAASRRRSSTTPPRCASCRSSSSTRFTALGSGEIDVLFRTSTQTMLRDTTLGLRHVTTYFYDGHGFMVRANSGVQRVRDMGGATICLIQGTTNEQVTADYFRSVNVQFQPVVFERTDQAAAALAAGRCDSFGTDASQLAAVRSSMPNPNDWTILTERFSKEPYGAVCPSWRR